jgi:hypothetical protein
MDQNPPPRLADDGRNTIYSEWEGEGDDRHLVEVCTLIGRRNPEPRWKRALAFCLPASCSESE